MYLFDIDVRDLASFCGENNFLKNPVGTVRNTSFQNTRLPGTKKNPHSWGLGGEEPSDQIFCGNVQHPIIVQFALLEPLHMFYS